MMPRRTRRFFIAIGKRGHPIYKHMNDAGRLELSDDGTASVQLYALFHEPQRCVGVHE